MIPGSIGLFLAVVGIIVGSNFLLILGLIIAVLSVVWAVIWMPLAATPAMRENSARPTLRPSIWSGFTGIWSI